MKEILKVFLWGQEIGRLTWHEARKTTFFMYNLEFLKGTLDIAPLVASIHHPLSTRAIFGETERIYQKLPSFIADSLPDAWGNQLFEQWRKANNITERTVTPLEKLAFIGRRGMGALEFVPAVERDAVADRIDIKALVDLANKIVSERESVRIMPDESVTLQSLIAVGTSAGGRQPKGIIAIDKETREIRSGQIDAEPNLEYYILKFGNKERSTAEIEQTYYEMALAAGINMMQSRIIEVEGEKHFLTKRFDRNETGKLHTQTLAAMNPEADSYEKLFSVCRKLHLPEVDCQELFRRMVFNILANNTDDHNKNFTFVMNRQGKWRLSPAYDMTYIFDLGGYLPNKEHCLMVGGKLQDITREDILHFARENSIHRADAVICEVAAALRQFRSVAKKNGVPEQWAGRIETTIIDHLKSWGEWEGENAMPEQIISGHTVSNLRIEQAYKGNFHLLATIDGSERKFIIGKNKEEYALIEKTGIANLTFTQLKAMAEKFFKT
ncbi:type II toxin-antitoxin system HipA family toxin [Pseudoprevotella muciniphila]|uniref:Type II toxin-antitoxin system HipA family toxin n=1 Tax=Pseudoprevotella muciniphila TaxID=2133944 RepID=A0A5P8E8A2_9BACT|nr:type II toxin-antitoxin system HipA family toxin [Pseudoprevotella muciniphila]QFQ13107.1 type II toxin-antitoxin system HipA family toxin [Pseudoprevotella muciniphila]